MKPKVCKHCGLPASSHHEFDAFTPPLGCVCDHDDPATEHVPCASFTQAWYNETVCANCDHWHECHAGARP